MFRSTSIPMLISAFALPCISHASKPPELVEVAPNEAGAWGLAVSADGLVVAGTLVSSRPRAFVWSPTGGFAKLGLIRGWNWAQSQGISADGNVVVGFGGGETGRLGAFRWKKESGLVLLSAEGASAKTTNLDGSVVGGYYQPPPGYLRAALWNSTGVKTDLSTLGKDSWVSSLSDDGAAAAGSSMQPTGKFRAVLWTAAVGIRNLGTLGGDESYGSAISNDGKTVSGFSLDASGDRHAFRWSEETGMQDLSLENVAFWSVNAMSADGQIVGGSGQGAVFWTPQLGAVSLFSYLKHRGVDTGLFTGLRSIWSISRDGSAMVGDAAGFGSSFLVTGLDLLSACPADLNGDGVVDDTDFSYFAEAYGVLACNDAQMPDSCPSDFNADGVVDDRDFRFFLPAYGTRPCE